MYQTSTSAANRKLNPYLFNEINSAQPEQLIMKVYDYAIYSCQKNDMFKTNDALQVLINALNFEDENAKSISIGLLRLYQFCQAQARKQDYQTVHKILTELRDAWQTALKNRQ